MLHRDEMAPGSSTPRPARTARSNPGPASCAAYDSASCPFATCAPTTEPASGAKAPRAEYWPNSQDASRGTLPSCSEPCPRFEPTTQYSAATAHAFMTNRKSRRIMQTECAPRSRPGGVRHGAGRGPSVPLTRPQQLPIWCEPAGSTNPPHGLESCGLFEASGPHPRPAIEPAMYSRRPRLQARTAADARPSGVRKQRQRPGYPCTQ